VIGLAGEAQHADIRRLDACFRVNAATRLAAVTLVDDAYSGIAGVAAVVTASMLAAARLSVSARATGRRSRFAMGGVRGLGDRACCCSRVGILDRLGPEADAEPYALSLAGARLAQDR
jgi:hypothetical protein